MQSKSSLDFMMKSDVFYAQRDCDDGCWKSCEKAINVVCPSRGIIEVVNWKMMGCT